MSVMLGSAESLETSCSKTEESFLPIYSIDIGIILEEMK